MSSRKWQVISAYNYQYSKLKNSEKSFQNNLDCAYLDPTLAIHILHMKPNVQKRSYILVQMTEIHV